MRISSRMHCAHFLSLSRISFRLRQTMFRATGSLAQTCLLLGLMSSNLGAQGRLLLLSR